MPHLAKCWWSIFRFSHNLKSNVDFIEINYLISFILWDKHLKQTVHKHASKFWTDSMPVNQKLLTDKKKNGVTWMSDCTAKRQEGQVIEQNQINALIWSLCSKLTSWSCKLKRNVNHRGLEIKSLLNM